MSGRDTGPKLSGRITRFGHAIKRHTAYLSPDWLRVARAVGYHNYQHLVRDVKHVTARTPTEFAQQKSGINFSAKVAILAT